MSTNVMNVEAMEQHFLNGVIVSIVEKESIVQSSLVKKMLPSRKVSDLLETNPIWHLVFWSFWAGIGIEFIIIIIAVNIKHYIRRSHRKRAMHEIVILNDLIKKAPIRECKNK